MTWPVSVPTCPHPKATPHSSSEGSFTVSLRTQRVPFSSSTLREFDPNLGRHDDFLLVGPYIFAQKTDSDNMINLYVSYKRQPFRRAMIPTTDPHQVCPSHNSSSTHILSPLSTQNYIVSHIDELQASVIVEHLSGQFNLYLSDLTGVYFSLSLPDIVYDNRTGTDLQLVSIWHGSCRGEASYDVVCVCNRLKE
jgi:hypothetical protein